MSTRRRAISRSASLAQKLKVRWTSYLFLLINVFCWGAALVIVKPSLEVTTPFRFLFYRFALAGVLSLGFIWHYWPKIKRPYQTIVTITKLELVGVTISLALLYIGLNHTTALAASLIGITAPIFLTLAGIWLLKEHEEKHEWIGLGLAFIGTIIITGLPFLGGASPLSSGLLSGNILIILSNLTTAIYFVWAKKYYQNWPKLFVAAISFWVGAVSFLILSLSEVHWSFPQLNQQIWLDWHAPSVWIASIYMATFGSIIGLTAYIRGQNDIEASEASVFYYLQPLVFLPLSGWLLKEQVSLGQIIGLVIILGGVILTETRRRMV